MIFSNLLQEKPAKFAYWYNEYIAKFTNLSRVKIREIHQWIVVKIKKFVDLSLKKTAICKESEKICISVERKYHIISLSL